MVRVRPANPEDLEAVAALTRQLLPEGTPSMERLKAAYGAVLAAQNQLCLVAVDRGKVIGMATMAFRECLWIGGAIAYVDELVVDAAARRRGVGGMLLETLEALAAERSCRRIELDTAPGREALGFYRAMGFQERAKLLTKAVFPRPRVDRKP